MKTILPASLTVLLAAVLLLNVLNILVLPTATSTLLLYGVAALLLLGIWTLAGAVFANLGANRQAQELRSKQEALTAELATKMQAANEAKKDAATKIGDLRKSLEEAKAHAQKIAKAAREEVKQVGHQEVLNFLSLLQSKGRLIDFLMDDVTRYSDQQVGAAARIVHQGCSDVIREYFAIKPVYDDQEGTAVTLEKEYDAKSFRLLGKVIGEPPYRGKLLHHGWRTTAINLPEAVQGAAGPTTKGIIAPAEVEIH